MKNHGGFVQDNAETLSEVPYSGVKSTLKIWPMRNHTLQLSKSSSNELKKMFYVKPVEAYWKLEKENLT